MCACCVCACLRAHINYVFSVKWHPISWNAIFGLMLLLPLPLPLLLLLLFSVVCCSVAVSLSIVFQRDELLLLLLLHLSRCVSARCTTLQFTDSRLHFVCCLMIANICRHAYQFAHSVNAFWCYNTNDTVFLPFALSFSFSLSLSVYLSVVTAAVAT